MIKTEKLVSVIIPTKNRPELLRRTLTTIINQDYRPLQIIISDDGSDPKNTQYLKSLVGDMVEVITSTTSTGVAAARNRGIQHAKGEWLAFCDDDDMWLPDKISSQINFMKDNNFAWCCSQVLHVNPDWVPVFVHTGEYVGDGNRMYFENVMTGGGSSTIVARDLLSEAGLFDTSYSMFADWELWTRICQIAKPGLVSKIGVLYLEHDNAMSMDQSKALEELQRYKNEYAKERNSLSGHFDFRGLEPTDTWVFNRILKSRNRLGAASMILDQGNRLSLIQKAKYLKAALFRPIERGRTEFDDALLARYSTEIQIIKNVLKIL